jgi:hypothetical protein
MQPFNEKKPSRRMLKKSASAVLAMLSGAAKHEA